ncbi:MAG TPA: 2-dehydro-3-deoxygalactonokinase [Candidatus Ruania gallistercoris]|uniref:2-dehydro-3-deoxygalactonokinase n=1 Tax=Candidatus Ruania gallistercoris TaxID=2838746 RepID=A0A9D2EH65_9MICO|nr:2-dehydro-3-deoxygalactonokinase [Candidatus Ruania gallistercoris]
MDDSVALVALDWGTSSCRAYALDSAGRLLDARSAPLGILSVGTDPTAYPEALTTVAGDWLAGAPPVLACGMVGSARGWQDAGYREAPVDLTTLATRAPVVTVPGPNGPVHLLPGVRTATGVMRGEETQLLGAVLAGLDADPVVLPGTHSKWAAPAQGRLTDFHTAMTGELYALLLAHGTIAQVAAPPGQEDREAFDGGARLGLQHAPQGVLSLVFEARSRVLVGSLPAVQVRDYLSGLLIAAEISGALAWLERTPAQVTLVGDEALCARYAHVLDLAGISSSRPAEDLTLAGLVHLARRLHLLPDPAATADDPITPNRERRTEQ